MLEKNKRKDAGRCLNGLVRACPYRGSCRAQMKMQEMAFVLVALVLLFSMIFVFYIKLRSSEITKKTSEIEQEKALSLLERVIAMPELRCSNSLSGGSSESLCLDKDKLDVMGKSEFKEKYKEFWKGIREIKVREIYPQKSEEYILFLDNKEDYKEYAAFTRLCEEKYNGVEWSECSLGIVSISI